MILGIETSCDETAAAVVTADGVVRANVVSSQAQLHARYGGVVPEVASRRHLELVVPVVQEALAEAGATLDDIESVAVTEGPGLIGALLVGLSAAKAIAFARRLPLVPVDHLHGHLAALYLEPDPVEPPFLALLASGGHTLIVEVTDRRGYRVIGGTLDDAAGEAFDKGARLLGLGYPGGPALERLAREGDPAAFSFPIGARMRGLDFSFAGLKTALLYKVRELGPDESDRLRADLAASYQAAIVESLALRAHRALERTGLSTLAVGGGVAANGPLRVRLAALGAQLSVPPRELCTDNAAMIAAAALQVAPLPFPHYLSVDVYASGERPPALGGATR
ncbi:MAG: tRNA (adenosine(37)-N6)-threonylcarbamoyltransferase complex transferase subunit TsaD [Solirubrobacteraceae bacterium]